MKGFNMKMYCKALQKPEKTVTTLNSLQYNPISWCNEKSEGKEM